MSFIMVLLIRLFVCVDELLLAPVGQEKPGGYHKSKLSQKSCQGLSLLEAWTMNEDGGGRTANGASEGRCWRSDGGA
jgi:hypothetical protein